MATRETKVLLPQGQRARDRDQRESTNVAQPTILLVDDEEVLRTLLTRILQDAGLGVAEAPNGRVALELADALGDSLGLVVTDIQMPVMTGPQFVREFRPRYPHVPVLYMTGRIPDDDYGELLLQKPFTGEAFLAHVRGLLDPT
jgi:two-component system, cell cycle sensor histidine kinase and response regulator CckA